jgi:adenylosuccinate lyase
MLRNLGASHGLVFSGRVLLALVTSGLTREQAYEIVQRHALRAWDDDCSFRALLAADPEVTSRLDPAAMDAAFDLDSFLRHVDEIFDRTLQTLGTAHA